MTRINGEDRLSKIIPNIFGLRHFVLWLLPFAKSAAFATPRSAGTLLRLVAKHGLPLLLFFLITHAIFVALGLRIFNPRTAMVITPFGTPAEFHPPFPYTGDSLANLMVDELQAIIRTSNDYTGTTDYSSRKQYGPLPETPKIPVQTSVEFQVHGVSMSEVLKFWNWLRYNQENISGEVVRTRSGKVRLRARLTSTSKAQYWELPGEIDEKDIPAKMNALAVRVFTDLHPETVGRYYLQNRKYQSARDVFAAWAKGKPESAEAYFELGYALIKMEQFEFAKAAEERALALQSGNHAALGQIALIYLKQADMMQSRDMQAMYEKAAEYERRAIRAACPVWRCWLAIGKRYPDYYGNLGALYERMHHFKEALENQRKVLDFDDESAGAQANTGSTLLQISQMESDPQKRDQEVVDAVKHIKYALCLKPYFPRHLGIVINTLLDTHRNKEAEEVARWAELMKPDAEEPKFQLGRIFLVQASIAAKQHDNREKKRLTLSANATLKQALRLQPQTRETLNEHTVLLQQMNSHMWHLFSRKAIELLSKQLQKEPDNASIYRALGRAHWLAGSYKKAATYYFEALEHSPGYAQYAEFHVELADALYMSNKMDSALTHYMAAGNLKSTAQEHCLFQFRLAHAFRYSSSKDLNKAIEAYAKGKRLSDSSNQCHSPSEAQFYVEYDKALRQRDRVQFALKHTKRPNHLTAGLFDSHQ